MHIELTKLNPSRQVSGAGLVVVEVPDATATQLLPVK
jgi:hypothetical protein